MRPDTDKGLRLKKGAWTADEDTLLKNYIEKYGEGKWHHIPLKAGLNRCRKSCRIRWLNYLRPNIKRGNFGEDEIDLILRLHKLLGNRWSLIAGRIPGRTANDVKNYWNTHICSRSKPKKKEPKNDESLPRTTTITVIKPQAQTISKTLNRYNMDDNQHIMDDNTEGYLIRSPDDGVNNNNCNMSSELLSLSTNVLHDEINKYLDVLFDEREMELEGHCVWSFGNSLVNSEALNVVEQENYNNITLFDFPIDEVVWNLKDSDQL